MQGDEGHLDTKITCICPKDEGGGLGGFGIW
jgi:hypothetical protein